MSHSAKANADLSALPADTIDAGGHASDSHRALAVQQEQRKWQQDLVMPHAADGPGITATGCVSLFLLLPWGRVTRVLDRASGGHNKS